MPKPTIALLTAILILAAAPAAAYQILLDIDVDDDPFTINELTYQTEALVRLIVMPDAPGDSVGTVYFGLGGSCLDCDLVHYYGTGHDLIDFQTLEWVQAPGFASGWDYATCLSCPDDPGFHLVLWFEPLGGKMCLDGPLTLAEFNAWVAPPPPPGCPRPPSNLATMPAQGEYWNYIQLGGPALETTVSPWGRIKAMFR